MNKVIEQAYKLHNDWRSEMLADGFSQDMIWKLENGELPEVEVGEVCELGDIWDGEGETPEESYSYKLTDMDWINYVFETVEENETNWKTTIKVTGIELL